jgi:serine/threonine protein phosphatase PrpC
MAAYVRIAAFTHRGRVRAANEDTIAVGDWVSEPEMAELRQWRHALSASAPLVCAVADGLGGHRAGEVASREAARWLAGQGGRLTDAPAVVAVLREIDDALYRAMRADPDVLGMGTTVVGLALAPRALWFNVGDSRLYRAGGSGGGLTQLSVDDTPPGRRSGLITQTLGGFWPPEEPVAPHVGEAVLAAPSRYLLCSDGLTDMLDEAAIEDCLTLPDAAAVAQLFERAMHAGGMDNISIVLVSVE